jgi:hypothetical protein
MCGTRFAATERGIEMTIPARCAAFLANVRRAGVRRSIILTVAAAAAVAAGFPCDADAGHVQRAPSAGRVTGYDGYWNVQIITDAGACDRAYSFPVRIAGGRVLSGGGARVSGSVGRGGGVVVRVSSGGSYATGSGRLGAGFGSGSWRGQGSAGFCSGRWQATRG